MYETIPKRITLVIFSTLSDEPTLVEATTNSSEVSKLRHQKVQPISSNEMSKRFLAEGGDRPYVNLEDTEQDEEGKRWMEETLAWKDLTV